KEKNKQDSEAICVADVAKNIELEHAEDRTDAHALEAIRTTRDVRNLVGNLAHDERYAEGHHQARKVGPAQHEKACGEAEQCGSNAGCETRQHRPRENPVLGAKPCSIRAEAEESGVSQRNDARIAQNEIEGERKQAEPGDFRQNEVMPGQEEQG